MIDILLLFYHPTATRTFYHLIQHSVKRFRHQESPQWKWFVIGINLKLSSYGRACCCGAIQSHRIDRLHPQSSHCSNNTSHLCFTRVFPSTSSSGRPKRAFGFFTLRPEQWQYCTTPVVDSNDSSSGRNEIDSPGIYTISTASQSLPCYLRIYSRDKYSSS